MNIKNNLNKYFTKIIISNLITILIRIYLVKMVKYNKTNNNKESSHEDSDIEDIENSNTIKPLKCFVRGCKVYFSDMNNFRRHLIMHKKDENREYVCCFQKCYSHFKCLKRLYRHFIEKHKDDLNKNEIKFLFDRNLLEVKDGGKKKNNLKINDFSNNNIKSFGQNFLLGQKSSEFNPGFSQNGNINYIINNLNNLNNNYKNISYLGNYNNRTNLDNNNKNIFTNFSGMNKGFNSNNTIDYLQNQSLNNFPCNNYPVAYSNNENKNYMIPCPRNLYYHNTFMNNEINNLKNNVQIIPPLTNFSYLNNFNFNYYQYNVIMGNIPNKNDEQINNQFSNNNNFDSKILFSSIGNNQINSNLFTSYAKNEK